MKASAAEALQKAASQAATAANEGQEKAKEGREKAAVALTAAKDKSVTNLNDIEIRYKEKVEKVDNKLDEDKTSIRTQKKAAVGDIKKTARAAGGHVADVGAE